MDDSAQRFLLSLVIASLPACTAPVRKTAGPPDIYHHTNHDVTRAPQDAAACIARNAERAGYVGDLRSLYGTEVMAVTVRTLRAGGTDLASVQLARSGGGSRAVVTTTLSAPQERKALITSLLAGC